MQSTFKIIKKQLIVWLFKKSQSLYVRLFKRSKKPWNITKKELLTYPIETFGYQYGQFLDKNNFEILVKLERHDAYHTLTGYQSNVEDEIALQYLCYGNGKRSIYLFGVIILGTFLLPDYYKYYLKSYKVGKNANPFYHWNFKKILHYNLNDLQTIVFSKTYLSNITNPK